LRDISIYWHIAKRAKGDEAYMDRSSEMDSEDVAEEIEDSSSEEEKDIEMSDTDEPEFDRYMLA
jgi:hypothetical protein